MPESAPLPELEPLPIDEEELLSRYEKEEGKGTALCHAE